ncbi:MAG TPA: DUF1707 domain-containing protein [Propionibacteriaceae bacterium]|nr:DUF1707 domain-containing protein [Propionibacteriaceae bacterium]
MTVQPPDPASLRASDHDRQLVADLITAAYADGRITRDELDERLEAVWNARTFGELTPITSDLVSQGPRVQYATTAAAPSGDRLPVVVDPTAPRRFHAILSSVSPDRGVHLPAHGSAAIIMGEVKLDLRGGSLGAEETVIDITNVMGSLKITVPAGVGVRDETTKIMAESKIRGLAPTPGCPVLVIRGTQFMAELKVNGPDRPSLGRILGITP